ncbi:MAG: DinB family protein [Candidatus Sulfotelmatobacter sp.]
MDARLERLKQALESAVSGMSSEQLNWHPPKKWSAAEVLEHLYLTYTGTIKGFDRVFAADKPLATPGSLRHHVRKLVVLGFNYMPEGRQAPETTRPKGLGAEKVRNELAEKIQAMDAIIAQCEAHFGRGVQLLDHPILGPLTATQWRKFHAVHGMHHHKQLVRLRQKARSKEKTS